MAIKYPIRKRVFKPGSSKPPIVNRGTAGHPTSLLGSTGMTTPDHSKGGGHRARLRAK